MTENTEQEIFRRGSTTYYWSSRFFPREVRDDVFRLYSFVRTADDYVDEIPVRPKDFFELKTAWKTGDIKGATTLNQMVLKNMAELTKRYKFDKKWVDDFLAAMESDLLPAPHKTLKDSQDYIYGSAGVIGLMMARIMGLPSEANECALAQGNAMQWVNFIRDIDEDNGLGRSYFPSSEIKKFGLKNLSKAEAHKKPEQFQAFVQFQIDRYREWQAEANQGFRYIPRRLRIPLKTAVSMYDWTAREIEKDPFVVFRRKVKPSKLRVFAAAAWNIVRE